MSWAMKRLQLLSIALVLCGHINGFSVWNRTSIIDWQAGHSNVTGNQNFHLATPVQPFQLLSRKGANGNVGGGGGNSSSVMLTSEVQTAQHDSSFVQSSGGAAHGKPVLNAHSQAAPTIQRQNNYTAQSSRVYWYESLKPNNCGPSLSQSWPVKAQYAPGFQRPSSSQSAGTTNQVSGSQTQSLYQPISTTQVLTGQSATSLAQSSGESTLYQGQASSGYNISQDWRIIPYSQSVANINQVSGSQTQPLYQPGTTAQVSASQSASTSQAQGSYGGESSGHAKWYSILQGQTIPSSSQSAITTNQISGFQTQSSYQPSSATQVLAGQSASTPQAQASGASLYQGLSFGGYLTSQGQSIPSSSQSVVTTNQISGFQSQSLYRPSSTTPVLAGQSASTPQAQSSGASTLYTGLPSGSYLTSQNRRMLSSSHTAVNTEQISGFQSHSYQPSLTTQVVESQSSSSFQAQGSYGAESSRPAKWYNILWGQNIPSSSQVYGFQTQSLYQPSSTAQVSTGISASMSQAQSSGASTLYQGPTSGRNMTSQDQSIPSSSQSVVTTNQISGFQNQTFQPNTTTQALVGHSASTSRVQGTYQAAKWHMINPSGFRTWLLNTAISPSLSSDTQSANNILPFLNQSAGTSAMSQNNVHSPAFPTSTQFSPIPQTAASPSVSLAKPSQQTQGSMVQSGIASLATSQTSPHVASTSQGTDIYAAVPSQGASQNIAGISFQGALPQVRHDQHSPVCNFPLGFCMSSQGAANNKFV
ncbi:uncharacterized protein LOC113543963 [Pangasianodon hypophthalmus]|uniref:uncharacterized protein LOC113543963 n=1 Tax=Pangasianodon hypophthalmus TaxID=310915 RepID=UPI000EFE5F73|nr:uncharacterized protein LOC113543963 [Pangasianodon hypophthalmus]